MNILILNGSPKGANSVTYHSVLYLEAKYSKLEYETIHVGQCIRNLENSMDEVIESINNADLIIFAYPVYTFMAPSQLHRFIELLKEKNISFKDKFVTQITTSKHFFDVTAHKFIQENLQDMGAKFIKGLSQDMDDLLTKEGQEDLNKFFRYVMFCIKKDIYENYIPFTHEAKKLKITVPENSNVDKKKDVVIVADIKEDDEQLRNMIDRFRAVVPMNTRLVNIDEYPFDGGCLGCLNCSATGKCVYKDGFDDYLRNTIQTADAFVFAFTIKDHSMGSRFKMYDDRQFCNGHRAVTMGKPMAYLISGDYSLENNLQTIIEARCEVDGNFLSGVATDENNPDAAIDNLAMKLTYAVKNNYIQPKNFYGVGGMKIFRDMVYLMQGLMRADHKFYKKHKQYDFPQKKMGTLIGMYFAGAMVCNPKMQEKMSVKITDGMLMPYKKIIDELK